MYGYQDFQYYLTQGNGPWGALGWTYDRIGNRLTETRGGVSDSYSYALNGAGGHTAKLDEITLGAGGLRAYGFDPAGNQTQVAEGADVVGMSYDDAGRLARIERPSVGFATDLLYDGRSYLHHAEEVELTLIARDDFETGDLACWSVVVGGTAGGMCPSAGPSVGPTYSSEGMLHHQLKPAGLKRAVLYFAGRPVAILELPASGPAEYLLLSTDHLGTPILASTLAGGVSWSGGFEPFGADWSGAEAAGVFLRFPGQWGDGAWAAAAANQSLYNVYRWYQPGIGAYTKRDPIMFAGRKNIYSYADSKPSRLVDIVGLLAGAPPVGIGRDPFIPPVDPAFGSGPWGVRPDGGCCDPKEILDSIASASKQIFRLDTGSPVEGSIGSYTVSSVNCTDAGWCVSQPIGPFDPPIGAGVTDPCVIYCIRVHEWYHYSDRRVWNYNWEDAAAIRFQERPAYELEIHCLYSFQ